MRSETVLTANEVARRGRARRGAARRLLALAETIVRRCGEGGEIYGVTGLASDVTEARKILDAIEGAEHA